MPSFYRSENGDRDRDRDRDRERQRRHMGLPSRPKSEHLTGKLEGCRGVVVNIFSRIMHIVVWTIAH